MQGDGVSEELDFVCIVLPIGIAYWPLLFPCGRTGPCYSLVEEQALFLEWSATPAARPMRQAELAENARIRGFN